MRGRIREALASYTPRELPLLGQRDAAVMLLLHEVADVEHVVFQVRSLHVAHHRGEVGFPGGQREPGDATLLRTAMRETQEEIGVAEADVEVLGQLDDTVTASTGFRIRPYVGAIRAGAGGGEAVARREVSEVLHVPLPYLLSPAAETVYLVERDGVPDATPAYCSGEHVIWGATARVLARFLALVAPVESGA
ncbi:MAG: CoA pyrophosphatase [Dehalococcoidia bacterium]